MIDAENCMYAVAKYTAQYNNKDITLEQYMKLIKMIIVRFDHLGGNR